MKNFSNSKPTNPAQFIFAGILLLLCFSFTYCQVYDVQLVSVTDGDSLRLKFNNNFAFDARLGWIDAPESDQQFGLEAKNKLIELTNGQQLRARILFEDRFNRKVVILFRPDFTEINQQMVASGFAWLNSVPRSEEKRYKAWYLSAYNDCLGLWSMVDRCQRIGGATPSFPEPCKPSKFRKGKC